MLIAIVGMSHSRDSARAAHVIQVHNASNKKITKILASTDGQKYEIFSTGNGIKPGETVARINQYKLI